MTYDAGRQSEFMQDLDSMLYAAYVDGREDEREDIRKEVLERAEAVPLKERGAYLDMLLRLSRPRTTKEAA